MSRQSPPPGGDDAEAPDRPRFRKFAYRGDPLAEPPPEELSAIIARHSGEPAALITVLEQIQRRFGYLGKRQLQYVARDLGFPLARIYGVVTFYNWFLLEAPGKHQVKVCRGTACHVNGSALILEHLKEELTIAVDETTADGRFTLQTVACVGACSLAAVVVVGQDTHGRVSPAGAVEILAALRDDNEETP